MLEFEVLGRQFDEFSNFKLLRNMISVIITCHSLLSLDQSSAEALAQLVELFDRVFCGGYPPLRDVVRNVDSNLAVEVMK